MPNNHAQTVNREFNDDTSQTLQTISGSITSYLLDIQRTGVSTPGGLHVVLSETQGANVTRHVHSLRGIHAHKDAVNNWEWPLQDGLGSVRGVVDNSLAVLESRNYDPFGNGFGNTGTSQTNYGFTGELLDGGGLLDLRARRYAPGLGVFASLDPFEGMWDEPMSINGYSYVHGNPVNWTDPSGKILPFIIAVAIGAPIIAAVTAAAWNLFVEQGRGVGGASDSKCVDWGRVARAGGAAATGAVEAELGILIPPLGIAYGVGGLIKLVDGHSGWTPTDANRTLLGYIGLAGAYDQLQSNPYYIAGRGGGAVASIAISAAGINAGLNGISVTGGGSLVTSTGYTFGLIPIVASNGQLVVGVTGMAGSLAIAQDALRNIVFSIVNRNGNQDPWDLDEVWRNLCKPPLGIGSRNCENPKSPVYGHSVSRHGEGTTDSFIRRAAQEDIDKGQWYDNQDIVAAERVSRNSVYHTGPTGQLWTEVNMGRPVGAVIQPNGKIVENMTWVRIIRNGDGTIESAFPIRPEAVGEYLKP
ncbi:MAG: RHS repeat-associated core domain-containing protein [Anaerolineae bacterium]